MTGRLERLLNLRPGEFGRGLSLFAYLFLVTSSFAIGKSVRDALFLDRYSALQLPYVDIAISLLVGVWTALYLRLGRRTGVRPLLMGTLAFFAANCLLFWWIGHTSEPTWLSPVVYVWVGMFGVVAPAQVWTLANYVLTTREAKRLFGFIGSGATVGFIVGGFVVKVAATRLGTEATLLLMAVALVGAAGLVHVIWAQRPDAMAAQDLVADQAKGGAGFEETVRLLARSPYVRVIAAIILLSSFATAVAGWQFKALAKANIAGKDELAAFFGSFAFYMGILSLVVQWVVTGRLLRRFGVRYALFVVPIALIFASGSVLVLATLAAVVALRGVDQVLRYAIDKPAAELLYLPLPASDTLAAKSFIDTVIWRLGDGLTGLVVLLFAGALGFSAVQMSWVTLGLVGLWLGAAHAAQKLYVQNLGESIYSYRIDAERASTVPVLDRTAADLLSKKLHQSSDPKEIIYALELFTLDHGHVAHPAVRGLLQHASPEVRREALKVLDTARDPAATPAAEKLLYDADLGVRTQALLYLAHHARIDPLDRIEQLGNFSDFSIRSAMVSFLAQPGPTQNIDAARVMLDGMIRDADPAVRREAARLAELLPDGFDDQIAAMLDPKDPEVARHAIHAAGRLGGPALVPHLLRLLAVKEVREEAADALGQYGEAVVPALRDALVDEGLAVRARREVPGVLVRIATPEAQEILLDSLLDPDTVLRFRIISALNKLRATHGHWPFDTEFVETALGAEIMGHLRSYQILGTLNAKLDDPAPVVQGLNESMTREIERIFRLLQLLFPQTDLHSAHVGLRSRNRVVHDNALEFLENALKPEFRRLLLPLLDPAVTIDDRITLAQRTLTTTVPSQEEAVQSLLSSDDPWLKSCAAYAIGALGLTQLAAQLDRYLDADDLLLRETARQAKAKLAP